MQKPITLTFKGISIFVRRNVEDFRKAIDYYDQAIQLDPNYALGLCRARRSMGIHGRSHRPAPDGVSKSPKSMRRKLSRLRPIWRRRARLSAWYDAWLIGNLLKALPS